MSQDNRDFFEKELLYEKVVHCHWNLLLLAIIANDGDLLSSTLQLHGYRCRYYQEGYDPLDKAIQLDKIDLLDRFYEYFKEAKNTNFLREYLNLERFVALMMTSSHQIKRLVLQICFEEPAPLRAISAVRDFPMEERDFVALQGDTGTMNKLLRDQILAEAKWNSGSAISKIRVKIFDFAFDDSIVSPSCYWVLKSFYLMSDDMKLSDMQYIIHHIWDMNFWTVSTIAVINLVSYLLFAHQSIYHSKDPVYGAVVISLSIIQLMYELVAMSSDFDRWRQEVYNLIDFYQYIARPAIVILSVAEVADPTDLNWNLFISFTVLVSGFRALGEFMIYRSTRMLISMITQTILDMASFLVVLICMIFVFGLSAINISKVGSPTGSFLSSNTDFRDIMDYYYNVANGDWDAPDGFNLAQYANYYLSTIILSVMMMNLLIAVISLTFEEFQEKKDLVDINEKHKLLYDHAGFFRALRKCFCGKGDEPARYRHCFLIRETDEADVENIAEKVDSLEERCGRIEQSVNEMGEKADRRNMAIQLKVDTLLKHFKLPIYTSLDDKPEE